jgi:hypothetical protein
MLIPECQPLLYCGLTVALDVCLTVVTLAVFFAAERWWKG